MKESLEQPDPDRTAGETEGKSNAADVEAEDLLLGLPNRRPRSFGEIRAELEERRRRFGVDV